LHSKEIGHRAADIVLVLTSHRVLAEKMLFDSGAPVVDCSSGEPRLLCWR
jgi:hypothetical protein